MIGIHWGLIRIVTNALYIGMIILFPFSPVAATIMLFALIAFWSRLPGIAIATPLWVLYMLDFVDLFSMLIAINVGGVAGGLVAAFCNFIPRIAGITPPWSDVVKDTIIQPIICLFIPFVYAFVQDITVCMVIYTLLRQVGFFIAHFVYPEHGSFPQFLVIFISYTSTQTFVNFLYGKYFGSFFDGLLSSGIHFNMWLFTSATILMLMLNGMTTKRSMKYLIRLFRKRKKIKIKSKEKVSIDHSELSRLNEIKDMI